MSHSVKGVEGSCLIKKTTYSLANPSHRSLPEASLHKQREPEHCSKASAHLVSSQVSPSAQPQVPCQALQWGSSRSQFVLSSSSPPGLPLCTGTAGWEGHCKVPVADLVDLSPVTLQSLSLISSKDSTRTVTEHGGEPATLKPRAAKSQLNQGWQAPACGWFENQFPIAPAGITSVVSPTKILRSWARQLLSLKNYQWRFPALPSNTWPAGLKRNEEDLP